MKTPIHTAACLALLLALVPDVAQTQTGGPALVRVAEAGLRDIAPVTLVPGTVVSRNDARLSAEVPGRLISVVDVGTEVAAGEAVAVIEDTALRLQYAEIEAQVGRAEASLRFLESDERRFSQLVESNLAAATQLEQTRSDRDVARGDLEIARVRLQQLADQLQRTRIRAPYDGMVVERLMTPGERVIEGSQVVRLVDQDDLEIIARAPLDYFPYVDKGQSLDISTGNRKASGIIRTVVAVGDYNTHQFELRLDLESGLFPVGQTVRVSIPTATTREVLTVPRDALVLRPEGESVFVVNGENLAQQVEVTVGSGRGDYVEIMGNVSPGDRVVIRGNERLQSGQSVSILDG
jgi:RND family efflux transporter MFP subunit